MTDIGDLVTIADFAKEISVTPATVTSWMTTHNEWRDNSFDGDGAILALATFGNTRVFSRKALLDLAASRNNGAAVKAAGYVHPDKYAELERNYLEAINRIGSMQETINAVDDLCDKLADRLAAMEGERDHFERENSKNMETVQLLSGELNAAQSAVLSLSE